MARRVSIRAAARMAAACRQEFIVLFVCPHRFQYNPDQTETFIVARPFLHAIAKLTIKSTGGMTMNIKTILLGAAMLSTLSGAALAGALDNPGTGTPFFSS